MINTDVLIIGAGPAGLSLACQLVRYGIDFVIVEKNPGVTIYSKALGVQSRTLEIYEQLGVVDTAIDRGQIARKVRILAGGKVRGGFDLSNMGAGLSPYPYLFILEQSENERLLYEYLQSHQQDVMWQTKLENFTQDETGVMAQVQTGDGKTESISAKYLVGCDGARSPIRHALGLSFEGSTIERVFYLVDAQVDWEFGDDAGYACMSKSALGFFFPMVGEKRYRIIGTFPEGFDKPESEIVYEEVEQRIKEDNKLDIEISNVNWFSVYKVNTRAVNSFSVGRCFIAGDAAHIHTPTGAQGMNTGIQDTYNLAWKMALVIKGYAGEQLLDTYNEERLPNAQELLRTTDRAFNMMVNPSWFLSFMRTTIFPVIATYASGAVGKNIFSMMSQLGINYRDASASNHDSDKNLQVKAGDRMPYFLVDGVNVYDKFHAPKFHLVVFADHEQGDSDLQRVIETEYRDLINFQIMPINQSVVELFGTNRPFTVLLRPDNYIGCISTEFSVADLKAYLQQLSIKDRVATVASA